ncbi:FadR/GntR family transcriptional regulator [Ammoniphilus resinae]|uniref:GntR family transcriptional repressor for pyruvate dehydrogenase complex n=1 Tax=Ammoniphilus resinae TaxID=861532 RepID=A0ABS4GNH4_9BACL|nr:FadR/GntR family transcriptional regulator [Ammoniphilus resinae]MBP1931420.1 GntR family transcriptional repressor for pyruvate dehydrogenase complex [Ammoniphilus resinae]
MDYAPIKKQRVSDIIVERIKDSIENGIIKPGDKLPSERELASSLNVSRGTVREALSILEAKGVVEVQSGKGVFLLQNSQAELFRLLNATFREERTDLLELLELRQSLEGQASFFAAERRNEQDLENIKQALERLENSVCTNQVAAQEDYDFHMAIVEASHNSMMVTTLRMISEACIDGLQAARSEAMLIPGKPKVVLQEHIEIFQAINEANPEKARQLLIHHLENVKRQVIDFV